MGAPKKAKAKPKAPVVRGRSPSVATLRKILATDGLDAVREHLSRTCIAQSWDHVPQAAE